MAGHSKWANIKHKKERSDQQKGKIFTRLSKEIISSVKLGGPDPISNSRLRLAIQKAKQANMPNENIDRNIKKASDPSDHSIEQLYELYGYGGVGILVEMITDNKNRTASDLRIALNKCGGSLASPGSVSFNFDRKGVIQVLDHYPEEELLQVVIDAGGEDCEKSEGTYIITTDPTLLYSVKEALEERKIAVEEASIERIPKSCIACSPEDLEANQTLIAWLEGLDDLQNLYHNMEG